jgi:hypothetical protein
MRLERGSIGGVWPCVVRGEVCESRPRLCHRANVGGKELLVRPLLLFGEYADLLNGVLGVTEFTPCVGARFIRSPPSGPPLGKGAAPR